MTALDQLSAQGGAWVMRKTDLGAKRHSNIDSHQARGLAVSRHMAPGPTSTRMGRDPIQPCDTRTSCEPALQGNRTRPPAGSRLRASPSRKSSSCQALPKWLHGHSTSMTAFASLARRSSVAGRLKAFLPKPMATAPEPGADPGQATCQGFGRSPVRPRRRRPRMRRPHRAVPSRRTRGSRR